MRSRSLILLLALAGTALSGCSTGFDAINLASSVPGGGGTDTGGDGISGDTDSGEPNEETLTGGDVAIAYTSGSRSIDGAGRAQLVITAAGDSATVTVDPGSPIGFGGTAQMARHLQETNPSPAGYPAFSFQNSDYTEFRRITAGSDNVLQYWEFTDPSGETNYAAHYRNATTNQDAFFFGGSNATDTDPAAGNRLTNGNTVVYGVGNYAGQGEAQNWGEAGTYDTADGFWRMQGTASVTANFGTGDFNGTLTPQYWEKFEDGEYVRLDVVNNTVQIGGNPAVPTATDGSDIRQFHTSNVTLTGTIAGNRISGDANLADPSFVNGERALHAAVYGDDAEHITGVYGVYSVLPDPTGGDTGINDDRRGIFDQQGVFHAQE